MENDAFYEKQILLADEYISNFDYIKASEIITTLEQNDAHKLKAYEREVYYLYLEGRYEEAQKRIEEIFAQQLVVENSYNSAEIIGDIYAIMGNCSYELEDYPNARKYLEEALTWNSGNPSYYRDYAVSLAKSGMLVEAESQLQKAKEYGMDEISMDYVKAEIESVKGNLEGAISLLEPIINNKSNVEIYNRALLLAANNYVALGNYEQALYIYKEIYDSGVNTYQVGENIAYLYTKIGDYNSAEDLLLDLKIVFLIIIGYIKGLLF